MTTVNTTIPSTLPSWVTSIRPQQLEAAEKIARAYENGASVVLCDGPTGVGKTIIPFLVQAKMGFSDQDFRRLLYTCTTHDLQDQFCVGPDTRVLTSDLRWTKISAICVGDNLVGFDEERAPNRRHYRKAIVEEKVRLLQPSYLLSLEDGTEVVSSTRHRWLTGGGRQPTIWLTTGQIQVRGQIRTKLLRLLDPWVEGDDWESGYLAGAFDGEGWLSQRPPARGNGWDVNLGFSQNPNGMKDLVEKLLKERGFAFVSHAGQECARVNIGHRSDQIRFLGQIRPERLLHKFDPDKLGMINPLERVEVIGKKYLGLTEVIGIKTSTGTFIAEGFASHNSSDFPDAFQLRGRANYPSANYPDAFHSPGWDRITCADCNATRSTECSLCPPPKTSNCPYEIAKQSALKADLICTNTSYFLSEANFVGRFSGFPFVVADEGDVLPDHLMKMVEVRVPRMVQKQLSITTPRYVTKPSSWVQWFEDTIAKLDHHLSLHDPNPSSKRDVKFNASCQQLLTQLQEMLPTIGDSWAYVGDEDSDDSAIVFKPIEPAPWGMEKIWTHGKKWLLMSATLISGDMVADELGLTLPYESVYLDSPFPPTNRPIRMVPVANMSYKTRQSQFPKLVEGVEAILAHHADDRVLIHTHTYSIAKSLQTALQSNNGHRPIITYTGRQDRADSLSLYKSTPRAVLLAPSMERGIDLPDDLCRAVIICQLPNPYIGDRQVSKRVYGTGAKGRRWYTFETMKTLVQQCGRAVRHESDHATTYIMDSRFGSWLDRAQKDSLAPQWWLDAIELGNWRKELGIT